MLLKGAFLTAAITAGIALTAGLVVDNAEITLPGMVGNDARPTWSQAPISLGNPAAAATLTTRAPETPSDPVFQSTAYERTFRLKSGETLAGLLRRARVPVDDIDAVLGPIGKKMDLRRLKAGQDITLAFRTRADDIDRGDFLGITILADKTTQVFAERTGDDGFRVGTAERQLVKKLDHAQGVIDLSLYVAGTREGLPAPVLAELIRVYSWDVDFQRDIRKGDRFEIFYERFDDENNDYVHAGDILYASMTLSGKTYPVYLHQLADGSRDYFDDKGKSAKKALMRTPINGARLSSSFGKRKHPILGYTKVHKGADFAAPKGTPIYAAGNGTVEVAGWNGAYGKYVRIRHNSSYATAYAHMSRIKTGKGRRVKQGQVIGYVGSTGRSTGPHLHYEILKNKRQVNPMTVRMPSGTKLKGTELARFQKTKSQIEAAYAEIRSKTPELAEAK